MFSRINTSCEAIFGGADAGWMFRGYALTVGALVRPGRAREGDEELNENERVWENGFVSLYVQGVNYVRRMECIYKCR